MHSFETTFTKYFKGDSVPKQYNSSHPQNPHRNAGVKEALNYNEPTVIKASNYVPIQPNQQPYINTYTYPQIIQWNNMGMNCYNPNLCDGDKLNKGGSKKKREKKFGVKEVVSENLQISKRSNSKKMRELSGQSMKEILSHAVPKKTVRMDSKKNQEMRGHAMKEILSYKFAHTERDTVKEAVYAKEKLSEKPTCSICGKQRNFTKITKSLPFMMPII